MRDLTKRRPIRSKSIRKSAEGESCTWPGCSSTYGVVLAHSNMSIHGKGMKRKADDIYGAYLCGNHHQFYDKETSMNLFDKEWHFMRAMSETWRRLIAKGIIKIKDYEP